LRTSISAVIFLALLGAARAQGEADGDTAASREHFTRGRQLYLANHNEEALREFEAGFQAVPRPEFLINMGLCQLRLGHPREARDLFRKFLAAAPETHRMRHNVEQLLAKAEADLAHTPPPVEKPPTQVVAPEPVPTLAPQPIAPPAVIAPAPQAATIVVTPPPRKSFARRNWWIFPVVGVVVVGVAVGLGVGLTQSTGCAAYKGTCVDASH
jgi:tetratricopeptide (TPR) repeat protein